MEETSRRSKTHEMFWDKLSGIKESLNFFWIISSKKGNIIRVFYLSKIRKRKMKRISLDKLSRMDDFKFFARQTLEKKAKIGEIRGSFSV